MKHDLENLKIGYHPILENYGYYIDKLDQNVLDEVSKVTNHVQNNFDTAIKHNNYLAGEIKHEYILSISPAIKNYMKGLVNKLEQKTGYSKRYYDERCNQYGNEITWTMDNMWINYQKKYEYNPIHEHEGLYSWVIWYKLPYIIEDEVKHSSKKQDPFGNSNNHCLNGYFSFIYSKDNKVVADLLPVDNHYEGYVAMFPSDLHHQVHPFYSSDDYRITISGNIVNTRISYGEFFEENNVEG